MDFIRIDAAGSPGQSGSQPGDYPPRELQAPYGKDGEHGMSATAAKPGTDAQNIQLRLHYLENEPGIVQAAGEGIWTGKPWRVPQHQDLFLDCRGGAGGDGGKGQDGQIGGQGYKGRDATRYRDAEQGGTGGRGGDGGAGSNGADGGNAGNVFITVGEDDLDLLIACRWDTTGGRGGASGTHGMPGDGGIGGKGGKGCRWTERYGDRVVERSRPPGAPGYQGGPGAQMSTYLMGGRSGKEGSTQIRVLKKDLSEGTYAGRYDLEVVSFDVLDENDDGINEPGEHLLVRNIKVKNKGIMPSPGPSVPIKILIHGTHWLEPIESEPVEIPPHILPGATVDVPGTLRAFIRNETSPRPAGQPLKAQEQVTLIATFYKRLNRALPGFCGNTNIDIQYPLQLLAPHCLDCVQKGDRVRFSWSLVNISRKAYGVQGITGRYAATTFSDPDRVFDLPYANQESEARHEAIDEIEELNPGEEVPIEQDFIVSAAAMEYSDAELHVQLMLADPHLKESNGAQKLRPVMKWDIKMQVSGVYQHDPLSRFLLVINSKTPNWAIHQVIGFIRTELHLGLDIFNLSVTGSFVDNATKQQVLPYYSGKSILVWGNTFPYFNRGDRNAWQLLDAWQVCSLAKGGTGFSFIAVENEASLRQWAQNVTFSGQLDSKESNKPVFLPETIQNFQNQDQAQLNFDITVQRFKAKLSFGESLASCFMGQSPDKLAQKAVKKVDVALPLRRFMAVPMEGSQDSQEPLIGLVEGLPKTSVFLSTTAPPVYVANATLLDYHKYLIIKSLPFEHRAKMFWNAFGSSQPDADGNMWFPSAAVYQNMQWHPTQGQTWDTTFVHSNMMLYLGLTIQSSVGTEISRFLAGKVPSNNSIRQLPLLHQLLTVPQPNGLISQLHSKEQELFVPTLSSILGSLYNIGFGQWFSHVLIPVARKRKLRNQTATKITEALKTKCDATLAATLQKAILEGAKATKQEIKAAGDTKELGPVVFQKLVTLTGVNAPFLDLTFINPTNIAVTAAGLDTMRAEHGRRGQIRFEDERGAIDVIARHVNPDLEEEA